MKKTTILKFMTLALCLSASVSESFCQWTSQATSFPTSLRVRSISIVNDSSVWVSAVEDGKASASQLFSRTNNYGTNWTYDTIDNTVGFNIASIHGLTDSIAFVAMAGELSDTGGIYKTTDAGANWVHQSTATFGGPNANPNFVYFFNDTAGVCVGNKNGNNWEIYRTLNGGTLWSRVDSANIPFPAANENGFANIFYASWGKIWFVSNQPGSPSIGRIYRSNDWGATWMLSDSIGGKINSVAFKDTSNGLLVTSNNLLFATSNGGANWDTVMFSGPMKKNAIAQVKGSPDYVTTSISGSSYSKDNGLTWTALDAVSHLGAIAFRNPDIGWSGDINATAVTGGIYKWGCLISAPAIVNTNNDYCIGQPISDIVTTGVNPVWYDDPALSVSIASNDTLFSTLITVSDTFYVVQISTGCPSSMATSQPVHITAYPNLTVTNPPGVCQPNTVSLLSATIVDANNTDGSLTYWTSHAATAAVATPASVGAGTYYVIKSTTFGACHSDTLPIVVTVNTKPNISAAEPAAVCYPQTINLVAVSVTDAASVAGTLTYWVNQAATIPVTTPTAVDSSATYYIVKTSTAGGCKDTAPVIATIIPLCLGVADATSGMGFDVFPNPSNGTVYINIHDLSLGENKIVINNVIGEKIIETYLYSGINKINLNGLANGFYIITLRNSDKVISKKLILN